MQDEIKTYIMDKVFSERPCLDDDWDFFMSCNEYDTVEGFYPCQEFELDSAYALREHMSAEYEALQDLYKRILEKQ